MLLLLVAVLMDLFNPIIWDNFAVIAKKSFKYFDPGSHRSDFFGSMIGHLILLSKYLMNRSILGNNRVFIQENHFLLCFLKLYELEDLVAS